MEKRRTGLGGRNKVIYVGGAEVRLIKAGEPSGQTSKKMAGSRSVFVPTGGRRIEGFPAVARLVRSMREILPDDPDEGGEARGQP